MKRSPLRRKTPLRAAPLPSAANVRKTTVRTAERKSGLNRGKGHAVPEAVYAEVVLRDRGCRAVFTAGQVFAALKAGDVRLADAMERARKVVCWGRLDPHHIWRRGQGGPDEAWNLVLLCRAHHSFVHDSGDGRTLGLLKPPPLKGLTTDE